MEGVPNTKKYPKIIRKFGAVQGEILKIFIK